MTARPLQNALVAWREINGSVVIISPVDSVLHELNATGSLVWKLSTGQHTTADIAGFLAEEFEVAADDALADTQQFVAELERKQLLTFSGGGGHAG